MCLGIIAFKSITRQKESKMALIKIKNLLESGSENCFQNNNSLLVVYQKFDKFMIRYKPDKV